MHSDNSKFVTPLSVSGKKKIPTHAMILVGILVLAAGLRLVNLTQESAWLDEVFSVRFVATRNLLQVIIDTFKVDFHPFSYYVLLDMWTYLFGYSDFATRLLSVLLGAGAVFTAYLFTKTAFRSERAALLCAFVLAISPTHIRYSQEVRMYVLLLLAWPLFLNYLCESWRTGYSRRATIPLILSFIICTWPVRSFRSAGTALFYRSLFRKSIMA